MSIFTKIGVALGITSSAKAIAVATTTAVVQAGSTALTQAVAAAAQAGNPIGDAAIAAVQVAEDTSLSGAEKKAQVKAKLIPVIVLEVATKGFTAFEADVEQFADMLIEEVVAKVKQTSLLEIATAVLKLLGLTK